MVMRVTVEAEGTADEVVEEIRRFLHGWGAELDTQATASATQPQKDDAAAEEGRDPQARWSWGDVERIWERVTPNCRTALATIARLGPTPKFDDVARELGVSTVTLGRHLTSLGHALRWLEGLDGKPVFLDRDYRGRRFLIDPAVAGLVLRAVEELGA